MSKHDRDHEDVLRHALHSAVDSIELSGDSLDRIRSRLTTPRPTPVAWLMSARSETVRLAGIGLSAASVWLSSVPAWLSSVPAWLSSALAWLRSASRPPPPRPLRRP